LNPNNLRNTDLNSQIETAYLGCMEVSMFADKHIRLSLFFSIYVSKVITSEEVSLVLLKSEDPLRSISTSNELSSEKYRLSMLFK